MNQTTTPAFVKRNQFTLTTLFVLLGMVSAYFAGRIPQVERARHAEALAVNARQELVSHSADLERVVKFWSDMAEASRHDIANAITDALIQSLKKGTGYSLRYFDLDRDSGIRAEHLRWAIAFSADVDQYAKQLDALEIRLIGVWREPSSIQVLSNLSGETPSVGEFKSLARFGVRGSDYNDFLIFKKTDPTRAPYLIAKAFPSQLLATLRMLEGEHAQKNGTILSQIDKTRFVIRTNDAGDVLIELDEQLLK